MAITIKGVVKNGVVVPNGPLPEGARVDIHLHDAPLDASVGLKPTDGLRERFQSLVRQWKEECGPVSSARRMAAQPAYRAIVALGQAAVPLLLAELEQRPDHWFIALHELTGAELAPGEARGYLDKMAAAWIQWGRQRGFVS